MKHLFITHKAKSKKKSSNKESIQESKDPENYILPLNSSLLNLPESQSNQTLTSSTSSTINSYTESRKISSNFSLTDSQMNINPNINNIINFNNYEENDENKIRNKINVKESIKGNDFLGKKTKIQKIRFDIMKQNSKKSFLFNINKLDNNSKEPEESNLMLNKDFENKNEILNLFENQRDNLNILTNYDYNNDKNETVNIVNNKNKNDGVNEGRWSYDEHIKFIEAITKYGKNWKNVQNYIGTRTSTQARSHSQKFFLKLKTIKNNKFNLDFTEAKIQGISDIIDVIKKSNKTNNNNENNEDEYIINTLISLSESINNNGGNDIYRKKSSERKSKLKEEKEKVNLNDHKECLKEEKKEKINEEIINSNISNNNIIRINIKEEHKEKEKIESIKVKQIIDNNYNINKNKKIIFNNTIINSNNNNINDNKFEIPKSTVNITVKNNNNKNINNDNNSKNLGKIEKKKEIINSDINIQKNENAKYIFDDGVLFLKDDSDLIDMNNYSLKIKNYLFMKNLKSPYIKFISNFFS